MILEMKEARSAAVIDDAVATVVETYDAPFAGYLDVSGCYIEWIEATGTQSTTQGEVTISVGGNAVATVTADISAAIGDTQTFTVDGTYATAANPHVEFAAGDAIEISITAQAAGGTTTGQGIVHLANCLGA